VVPNHKHGKSPLSGELIGENSLQDNCYGNPLELVYTTFPNN
jgi:hypothetical protein